MKKYCMEEKLENNKPKIMLHIRALNQISGPNVCNMIIYQSDLSDKFQFEYLVHNPVKGIIKNLMIIPSLIKQIQKFNPDIIHVAGLQRAGFEVVIAAKLCRKKKMLTIHGSSIDAIDFKKKILYAKLIEPLTMRLSHKVYAVCDAMANREYIRKHTKGRLIDTIHNSAPIINKESIVSFGLRERYGIAHDAVVIAIVGRMVYDKGITYIIEAISRIQDKNIIFIFIGDGALIEDMKISLSNEIVDKRVILLGKQNNVLSILNECDIFLFATLHENLSNALLEACSIGLAVIATSVGGNPEVIKHGYNGLLIPPANAEEIVKSIHYLAENESVRQLFGMNAKKTIEDEFSQKFILSKLEKVYDDLL